MSSSFNIFIFISHVNPIEFLGSLDGLFIYRQVITAIISSRHSRKPHIIRRDYQSRRIQDNFRP
ncbi:hypothetical protein F383_06421 [Gossypium arboreum]|uniref:Uncharacterized protein n=1 Tax=Gossypium arboreum TaxID=29729 RepID=A0A0B0NT72_GOSAR|nr:hypothetical protein F383_06421 [Gossypium arboreum]